MKTINLVLAILFLLLQYRLWVGDDGLIALKTLQKEQQTLTQENIALKKRNEKLAASVEDLKKGEDLIEEHARYDLGMIQSGEVFYRFIEDPSK